MKTRGKGKTDVPTTNYAKDTLDSRDFGDDGEDTNGYPDDRADDAAQARSESRSARNPGNRRGSRIQRPVNTRGKSDKNLMESAEFQEVVRGFFEFIEEIKRKKKPKNGREPKPIKPTEEFERSKKVKTDNLGQALQAGKSELLSDEISLDKANKNPHLYSFKQDLAGKDLLDNIKRDKEPTSIFPPPLQAQDQLDPRAKGADAARQKDALLNKPGYTGANYLPSANLPGLKTQPQPQANKPLQNLYFDNPALFPDRLQLQGFPEQNLLRNFYMSPYDSYPYGVNSNQSLNYQLLEALLLKNQPELLASLLESAQGGNAFYDLQREAQRFGASQLPGLGNQRFGGNQNFNRLIDNGPEPINPKGFEGKLGRAATHVAIAYFIYFKSLDPDTIAKADKTKMDPTYNARMLKEKRTETYPADIPAMMGKLNPFYSGGLPMDNSYAPNMDFLERRLMEQRLLNQGINPALAAGFQGKTEKLEEEKAEPKRRTAEAREAARHASNKKPPKEEDIINIDEGSDAEEKPQQSTQKPDPKTQQKVQAPAPGPVSAEDIVQEIAELTGHSDADKKKSTRKPPSKSASEENQKPAAQKTFTVEEGEQPVGHANASVGKGTVQKEAPKNVEVILSSDEEVPKEEVAKKEGDKEKEPKIEEKIEEKMEEEINEIKEEEQDKDKDKKEKETEKMVVEQSTEAKPVEENKDEVAAPASE